MEFGLSEEQTLLQDSVTRYLDANCPLDRVRRFAEEASAPDLQSGLAELGVFGLLVPEDTGGVGLGCFEAALVAEALGSHTAPVAYLGSAVMAPLAITLAGDGHTETLSRLATGELSVGVAVAEFVGARADGGISANGGTLTGKALSVLDFDAQAYLVADAAGHSYLVEASAPGVTAEALPTIDKTRLTGALTLNRAPAQLISDDPQVLARVIDAGRVMLAADTLGAAQNMLDQAVEYANQREQFNRPIGSFQAVKHMCAEMAAGLEPCRAMVWYASHALDALPGEASVSACHAKAHLSEVGKFVAKTATEVHGGMGFTDLLGLHYWFKRIGYNRQMLGAPELLREQAARLQGLCA
ncbi:MAG: acyl-CoA dehydrogenase [Pseudomonadales bacterium]|nr:acyl-CoA/acyl-ACP dehydrogenase [Pseudomonadales bacterium]NIX09964.1 acyl-CoA dehydrogenase [Pseudomonadales bacterium]